MTGHDDNHEDERLKAMLAAADRDAPPPDPEFLARLRTRSTEAFLAAPSTPTIPLPRRRMVTFLSRALTAAALLLVVVGGLVYWRVVASPPTFGQVVARFSEAESLRLRVAHGDEASEVTISQPGRWRWEHSPEQYRLGDHTQSWIVDERANQAVPTDSPYFDLNRRRINVWWMLRLAWEEEHLRQLPVERAQHDGRDCYVYHLRFETPVGAGAWGTTTLLALVDAETQFLHSLEAKEVQGPGAVSLSALTVLAFNEQIPEDKLLVKETLSEDGRLGKVTDAQGIAALKPMAQERWTPVTAGLLLRPGDWLRTDPRGANAIACRLLKQTGLIVGPGSVLEVTSPTRLRLTEGELEFSIPEGIVELLGPDDQKLTLKGKGHYRVHNQKLVTVAQEPLWLKGFKGATANESIGSLIANVDGRNEPLTVGYHKVTVDIRDQIARTTIEESFVNHTDFQLEGVFYFPLPQDASISGFGMWIGNELVMADIVEKQRAREIYETILRERRDPGLLEWSGGNIFKARVFPIFAHSEKRIKIVYTQVLPLRGNRYRYSYALQSELLRQHPLRELNLDVRVSSAVPLKNVTCPTHPTRSDKTVNSARLEFTAQKYTPTRDFEVVVEVDGKQNDVVMIPHRRGEDGYFLLQLMPPAPPGDWDRPVLSSTQPLHLLILADTSASMDAGQRTQQAELVAALLGSLTPKDTINVACCDVECDWVFEKSVAADAKNAAAIRAFLSRRQSLGWTDLDKAFESVLRAAGLFPAANSPTYIIYIGDGTVTTRDADPAAFGRRLQRLISPQREQGLSFHAVAVGSSYEPAAMKLIGSLGGGSFRRVTNERGPSATALELLYEITQPVLRDLKVEFVGLRTARVYPEALPNLPPGTQQIVIGRYLPEGRDQSGEVIVTGTQGGKPIRFTSKVSLRDAEQGNSFIPRLWARQHLDQLLDQGSSASVRDDIIALSEDFQIITPYTSFLVLETDADRERFQVKRSFRMRDGEKFFQEGLDRTRFELAQQQMKRAGTWRLGLRRQTLREFATLGREFRTLQPRLEALKSRTADSRLGEWYSSSTAEALDEALYFGFTSDGGRLAGGHKDNLDLALLADMPYPTGSAESFERTRDQSAEDVLTRFQRDREEGAGEFPASEAEGDFKSLRKETEMFLREAGEAYPAGSPGPGREFGAFASDLAEEGEYRGRLGRRVRTYDDTLHRLLGVFPQLAAPVKKSVKPSKSDWPQAARDLARSLLRREKLAKLPGGIELLQQHEYYDTRWNELTSRSRQAVLYSPTAWWTRSDGDGSQTLIQWCDKNVRGTYSRPFQLGRVRTSTSLDLDAPPFSLNDHSLASLDEHYQGYTATVQEPAKTQALLILKAKHDDQSETRILIDTTRHVVLSIAYRYKGKVSSTYKFDDFVEVAGCWWARKMESFDGEGRRSGLTTYTIRAIAADAFAQRLRDELADRERVQFLRQPIPRLAQAKKAHAEGKATFDDHFTLLLHFAGSQQWTRVLEQLATCEKLAAGNPGMRWVRDGVLYVARRHEELKNRTMTEADRLAKAAPSSSGDDHALAQHLLNHGGSVLPAQERLLLHDILRPIYERQPRHTQAMKGWLQLQANNLYGASRQDDARALQQRLATEYPRDYSVQQNYASTLFSAGQHDAAYAWLKRVLVKESRWNTHEEESLRSTYANFLQQQGRYPDLVGFLADWLKTNPESQSPYQQYLGALVRADQVEKANATIAQWLKHAMADDLTPPAAARLSAAIQHALGAGHNVQTGRPDERWYPILAQVVERYALSKTHNAADTIMRNGHFTGRDECRQLRKKYLGVLLADLEKLTPTQIRRFVDWIWANDPVIEIETWRMIATGLRTRWVATQDKDTKHALGQTVQHVYSGRLTAPELLGFLREQIDQGPDSYRTQYRGTLFETLLVQPWTAELEREAFALLGRLSDAETEGERLADAVERLHRLTDRMVQARQTALMAKVTRQDKLSRTELRAKQEEARKLAREGFADRLLDEEAKIVLRHQLPGEPGKPAFQEQPWVGWLAMERSYLNVQLERNLANVADNCWLVLGDAPKVADPDEEPTIEQRLDELLRSRALLTLCHLATRRDAKSELTDRLLAYVDKGIAAGDEDGRWKQLRYRLLVALDRPKDLEKLLHDWIRAGDPDNRHRLALGYLLAEQGRIQEAIRLFEGVEFSDELGPTAYRALADWYLAANRREQHENALLRSYRTTPEQVLARTLNTKLSPWTRDDQHLPSELEKDVLLIFAALFEKSTHPANYVNQLQQFYHASRDFRLLAVLADGVLGHSAVQVYPFLGAMQSVTSSIFEEATADSLFTHLDNLREKAKTDIDHRALDLLELLVRRRAADLRNQPGPHVEAALAAMQRAFKRQWAEGEPRLMAEFLANLGAIPRDPLAKEQLRQLEALHAMPKHGSADRLHVAHRYAGVLWLYTRHNPAVDLLQAALKEFQDANGGILPVSANAMLNAYLGYLEYLRHFGRSEKTLFTQLEKPVHQQQTYWLKGRLYLLYNACLAAGGEVSLGAKLELYRAVIRQIRGELGTRDHDHRYQLVAQLCAIYRTAHAMKVQSVADDLRDFAFKQVPHLLEAQTNLYTNLVNVVSHTLHDLASARDGLAFLIERIENEPAWFRLTSQDGWSQHSPDLDRWRIEVKALGDLEPRLLKLVTMELRRDLETRHARNRFMYYHHSSHFWSEKADVFLQVAGEVLAKNRKSNPAVQYVAEYVFGGLGRYTRAIEMLYAAHKDGILDDPGQATLVRYLHHQHRYEESIALLRPLVRLRPDNLNYRVQLMHAEFHTKRQGELLALLRETEAAWRTPNRWTEGIIAALAESCRSNELHDQAVGFFHEVISLHQRTQPNRGIGNGTLSNYYVSLARVYAALRKTPAAVDAASAAIVSWGSVHDRRADSLQVLRQVLAQSPDLDGYVAQLDAETAKTGRDSPIIRKSIGQVYREKAAYSKAVTQLRLAMELQPNDRETHDALLACFDKQNDKEGAVRQLLQAVQLSRRDLSLYRELGQRLTELKQEKEAERAYTSIVEMQALESESHTMLAEVREQQGLWPLAIEHWRRVADLRALEPTGLIRLAMAQIHEKQWDAAAETVKTLRTKTWPRRFDNEREGIRVLEKQVETGRGKGK